MITLTENETTFLKNLNMILTTTAGQKVFEFLFKEFDVLGSPPPLLNPEQMIEEVAYRRMSGTIVKYVSVASPNVFALIMLEIAKEKSSEYLSNETTDEIQPEY